MTDEEYLFRQTERERKRIGRGDFNKKRQGGRHARLPSDNMTKKEWEKMNGEIKSYDMAKPAQWKEFLAWPTDLQKEYILGLERTFHATSEDIAIMMGCAPSTLRNYRTKIGCAAKRGGGKREPLDTDAWECFWIPAPAAVEKCEESPEKSIEKCEDLSEKLDENSDELDEGVLRLAMLLQALKGTGAKLTIEVTL